MRIKPKKSHALNNDSKSHRARRASLNPGWKPKIREYESAQSNAINEWEQLQKSPESFSVVETENSRAWAAHQGTV